MSDLPFSAQDRSKKIYFSTAARITRVLGRESVSDPVIALLELIKNSYDADATKVVIAFVNIRQGNSKIIVEDNGLGMTEEDIKNKWMRAATNIKEKEPFSSEQGRRRIGEKGIGRFATERIANRITLVSYPYKHKEGYGVVVDWSEFDKNPDDDFEKIPSKLYTFSKSKQKRGFKIYLENLSEKWDENKIKKFRDDVSLILPPTGGPKSFSITIKADEFEKYSGKVKSSFLKDADYMFSGRLEKNGVIKYVFKTCSGEEYKEKDKLKQFSCGPVEFQLYFYFLGPSRYIPKRADSPNFDLRKSILEGFGGIKLYRDNFRIKPFGDPGNDWLGIDSERVNDPTNYPSNNQILGIIKLKKDENKGIDDTASRENIIDSKEFSDLKRFMSGSLKFFAKKRKELADRVKSKKIKKKKSLIKESFKKPKKLKSLLFPLALINKMPLEVADILLEVNGCLSYGFLTAAAILMRKVLETATVIKFKQEKKESKIKKRGEYVDLPKRIEISKQEGYFSSTIARRLNKIKLFGDTAAHSYRIAILEEDIEPMRDVLRLALEDIKLKK